MKKLSIILAIILLLISFKSAFAVSTNASRELKTTTNANVTPTPSASLKTTIKDRQLENLRTKAEDRIDNRIDLLNLVLKRLDADEKSLETDQAALKKEIEARIVNLNTLKNKISQDLDSESIRKDFDNTFSEKIFAYYVPKIRLLITINNLLYTENQMQELIKKVNALINALPPTSLTSPTPSNTPNGLLKTTSNISSKLTEIKQTLEADKIKLNSTTPSSYKETFTQIRQDLARVRANFAKVKTDIASLRKDFKIIIKTAVVSPKPNAFKSITPKTSPELTPTPTKPITP